MNLDTPSTHIVALLCILFSSSLLSAKTMADGSNPKPVSFIENRGQVTDGNMHPRRDIQYKLDIPGITVFIGASAIHYQWVKAAGVPKHIDKHPGWELKRDKTVPFETYRLDMALKNANISAEAVASEQQPYYETYYLPHILAEGTIANTYNRITYKNVYPNIDWVLYTTNGNLKYDFVVHAGGNVQDIQMLYSGNTSLKQAGGKLIIETPFGNITEDAPYTYDAETRQEIPSQFIISGNTVGFSVAASGTPLVIDPSLQWSTYYGGSLDDEATSITADPYGNVYIAGHSISTNNIATSGAYQALLNGIAYDAYLVKADAEGNRLWATYFGGPDADYCNAVTFTKANHGSLVKDDIYIVGNTYSSTGITLSGGFNVSNKSDGFYAMFTPNGLKGFSGYIGGEGDDMATCIALSPNHIGVIGGYTTSADFGAYSYQSFQPSNAGGFDGFYTTGPFLGQQIGKSFLGGTGNDYIMGVAISPDGYIYLTGTTESTTGIAYGSPLQPANAGGNDGFISKRYGVQSPPVWSTYFGSTGDDYLESIAFIDSDNFAVAGSSKGNGQGTPGVHQQTNAGLEDGLVATFNKVGQLNWAGYVGGTADDRLSSVTIDINKNIHTAGYTFSTTGIATTGALQNNLSGTCDAMLATFNPNTGTRIWGSYYGGSSIENFPVDITSMSGLTYFTGSTYSNDLNIVNGHQQNTGGLRDGFIGCTQTDTGMYITSQSIPDIICGFSELNIEVKVSHSFNAGNVFTIYLADPAFAMPPGVILGTLASTAGGVIPVIIPNNLPSASNTQIYVTSSDPVRTTYIDYFNLPYNITPGLSGTVYTGAYPSNIVTPGTPLMFALTIPPGTSGTYQWQKNNVDIPGATNDTLYAIAGTDIMDGDSLWCVFTSPVGACNIEMPFPSIVVHMTVSLDINEINKSDIRIYPNPTNGNITITGLGNTKTERFTITDVMGKTVHSGYPANSNTMQIELPTTLPNGIYLLKLETGNGTLQYKLSLQR